MNGSVDLENPFEASQKGKTSAPVMNGSVDPENLFEASQKGKTSAPVMNGSADPKNPFEASQKGKTSAPVMNGSRGPGNLIADPQESHTIAPKSKASLKSEKLSEILKRPTPLVKLNGTVKLKDPSLAIVCVLESIRFFQDFFKKGIEDCLSPSYLDDFIQFASSPTLQQKSRMPLKQSIHSMKLMISGNFDDYFKEQGVIHNKVDELGKVFGTTLYETVYQKLERAREELCRGYGPLLFIKEGSSGSEALTIFIRTNKSNPLFPDFFIFDPAASEQSSVASIEKVSTLAAIAVHIKDKTCVSEGDTYRLIPLLEEFVIPKGFLA